MPEPFITFNYLSNFHCIADRCEDDCCSGWRIPVDRVGYDRLLAASVEHPKWGRWVNCKIGLLAGRGLNPETHYAEIANRKDGRCAFLGGDRFCDIQRWLGPDFLGHDCAWFPRRATPTPEGLEVVGLLTCPEMARRCLLEPDATAWLSASTVALPSQPTLSTLDGGAPVHERWLTLELAELLGQTELGLGECLGRVARFIELLERRAALEEGEVASGEAGWAATLGEGAPGEVGVPPVASGAVSLAEVGAAALEVAEWLKVGWKRRRARKRMWNPHPGWGVIGDWQTAGELIARLSGGVRPAEPWLLGSFLRNYLRNRLLVRKPTTELSLNRYYQELLFDCAILGVLIAAHPWWWGEPPEAATLANFGCGAEVARQAAAVVVVQQYSRAVEHGADPFVELKRTLFKSDPAGSGLLAAISLVAE